MLFYIVYYILHLNNILIPCNYWKLCLTWMWSRSWQSAPFYIISSSRLSMVQFRSGPATFCRPQTWTLGQVQVWSGSGLEPKYCSVIIFLKLFVINIHIHIIIQKSHLSLLCSPKWFKANSSANILKLWVSRFIEIYVTFKMS